MGKVVIAELEHIARLEAELELVWEYADWESGSMVDSNKSVDVEGDGTEDAATYHSIMAHYFDTWPRLLRARARRRARQPDSDHVQWYGEPDNPTDGAP